MQIVRAEEEIRRGRMGMTVWYNLSWEMPFEISENFWSDNQKLKFQLGSASHLSVAPQTVFKNALYLSEHKTPLLNSILHVTKRGRFELHSKVTVDIPCVRILPMQAVTFPSVRLVSFF